MCANNYNAPHTIVHMHQHDVHAIAHVKHAVGDAVGESEKGEDREERERRERQRERERGRERGREGGGGERIVRAETTMSKTYHFAHARARRPR